MASSERRVLLPSLPFELIEEILYRTPGESLIRFKSTCKKWYTLITNKKFIYAHMDHSPELFLRIHNARTIEIMDPITGSRSASPIPEEFRNKISFMVHCDGLMVCMLDGGWVSKRGNCGSLVVWNPVSRKTKLIEPRIPCRMNDYLGIGYESTSPYNYKILRFSGPVIVVHDQEFEMYEFKSDSWRTIDAKFDWKVDAAFDREEAPDSKGGVSVKGNMYWIAKKGFILSFDFSVETFKNICFCPSLDWVRLLGCFNGDRLSLLLQDQDSSVIEVWLTNKLSDGVVTFTKYLNVTIPNLPALQYYFEDAHPGYSIGKHRNIMAWCEEKVNRDDYSLYNHYYITLYDIDEGGVRRKLVTGEVKKQFRFLDPLICSYICSYVYVPSLIPVPE